MNGMRHRTKTHLLDDGVSLCVCVRACDSKFRPFRKFYSMPSLSAFVVARPSSGSSNNTQGPNGKQGTSHRHCLLQHTHTELKANRQAACEAERAAIWQKELVTRHSPSRDPRSTNGDAHRLCLRFPAHDGVVCGPCPRSSLGDL